MANGLSALPCNGCCTNLCLRDLLISLNADGNCAKHAFGHARLTSEAAKDPQTIENTACLPLPACLLSKIKIVAQNPPYSLEPLTPLVTDHLLLSYNSDTCPTLNTFDK